MSILINIYSTLHTPPEPDFPHELNGRRDRSDPELENHLQSFIGYVQNKSEGQMTSSLYHLIRHIERVQTHFSLNVEENQLNNFADWALRANGICFLSDGSVRTPYGELLLVTGHEPVDQKASVPYPTDALDRKARHDAYLQDIGIHVPTTLPPVAGEGEVILRTARDVAARCLSLFSVALRGESLASGPEKTAAEIRQRLPLSFESFTSQEAGFMAQSAPDKQDVINACWRYEALTLLLWTLGKIPELPFPTAICNVAQTARVILEENEKTFLSTVQLRPVHEILDVLDLHYRLHWVIRQARLDKKDAPSHLDPGVVSERHYALNWLVRFENADWDEVDTPT